MLNKFNKTYDLLMEGLKSGYKHGNLMKNEIELRLPASNNFCTNILKK